MFGLYSNHQMIVIGDEKRKPSLGGALEPYLVLRYHVT
jgi:hypothetical protein